MSLSGQLFDEEHLTLTGPGFWALVTRRGLARYAKPSISKTTEVTTMKLHRVVENKKLSSQKNFYRHRIIRRPDTRVNVKYSCSCISAPILLWFFADVKMEFSQVVVIMFENMLWPKYVINFWYIFQKNRLVFSEKYEVRELRDISHGLLQQRILAWN